MINAGKELYAHRRSTGPTIFAPSLPKWPNEKKHSFIKRKKWPGNGGMGTHLHPAERVRLLGWKLAVQLEKLFLLFVEGLVVKNELQKEKNSVRVVN